MNYISDTIAAISTSMTSAGIGIIRISGENAIEVADAVFQGKKNKKLTGQRSQTIHYGYIYDNGQEIDEVLVSIFRGPRSFTGEDVAEINCHGGVYVMQKILELVVKNGARVAEPGEFTKRAFLNGRMDLSQAEAVMDLIESKNEFALKSSVGQLKGSVQREIKKMREMIIYHTAKIETALDDPEHYDMDGYSGELLETVNLLSSSIQKLIETSDDGRILKEGIGTVIVGKPNAGKSSLLNALVGEERAIVTDIAGTTRDVLKEQIRLGDISLNLIDTAGIRETGDVVEKIGVDKAKQHIGEADLVIFVVDASRELDDDDRQITELIRGKRSIILLNKSDLESVVKREDFGDFANVLEISAKEIIGIDKLENLIRELFYRGEISYNDQVIVTNVRHKTALVNALASLGKVRDSIDNQMPEDFYTIDLMDAYESLGSITGETTGEDLVNEIFSKFCMGK